jgi:hypothetical protein
MGSMYESLLDAEQIANYFPHVFTVRVGIQSCSTLVARPIGRNVDFIVEAPGKKLCFHLKFVGSSHGGGIFVVFIEKHFRNHGQKFSRE